MNRNVNWFVVILIVLLLVISTGCGNQTATDTITTQLSSEQNTKEVGISQVVAAPISTEAPEVMVEELQIEYALEQSEQGFEPIDQSPAQTFESMEETSQVTSGNMDSSTKDKEVTDKEVTDKQVTDKQVTSKEVAVVINQEEIEPQTTVTISIIGDEEKGVILKPTIIEWSEDDDVLDVLKRVTKSNKIPLEYRGSGLLSYVEGIANLYEFDQGASSGWLFKVNGEMANKSAGAVKLNKGDNVEWIYSLKIDEDSSN